MRGSDRRGWEAGLAPCLEKHLGETWRWPHLAMDCHQQPFDMSVHTYTDGVTGLTPSTNHPI